MGKSIVLVLSAVLSTTAFAQGNVAPNAPAKSSVAAPAAATSTAKIAVPAAEKPFHMEAYTKTVVEQASILNSDNSTHNEAFVGANYALGGGQKVGVRQLFVLDTPNTGDKTEVHMSNLYFYHVASDIVKINDNLGLSTTNRLYLPTGEDYRTNTMQLGSIRNYLNLVQKAGKWELSANLLSQWYANSQDRVNAPTIDAKTKKVTGHAGNMEFYFEPYVEAGYSVTESVTVTPGLGVEGIFRRADAATTLLDTYVTVSWQALKELSINLSAESESPTTNNGGLAPTVGRASDTHGILELIATL